MAEDNTGIIVFGIMIIAVGGFAVYMMKGRSETPLPPTETGGGSTTNVYNIDPLWYNGPRYRYWWDFGRRYYGRWFRDYDWDDYRNWLGRRHRDDRDVDRWLKNRYKAARKNRGGDRHNRDRDDNDKEWWKRAIDWDRDDKWKIPGLGDRNRDRDRNRNFVAPVPDDLVVTGNQPIPPFDT